jgi:acyl-coenzyme A synthetase/AMP-(fatty) acid ligase
MTIQPYEFLEHAAANNPARKGLLSEDQAFTFSEMDSVSRGLAERLRDFGVKPRDVVATHLPPADDWLVSLALFHEAAVGVSLWGVGEVKELNVAYLVSHAVHPAVPRERTIIINRGTLDNLREFQGAHPRTQYARGDKSIRHVLTSGTTGQPKVVDLTPDALEYRLDHSGAYWTTDRPEMNFMGLSTTGGFFTALVSLKHGMPFHAVERINRATIEHIVENQVAVLAGSPNQLGLALQVITEDNLNIPDLEEIHIGGDTPTPALLKGLHDRLGVPVHNVYGSTEGGGVTLRIFPPGDTTDPDNVGPPVEGMEIEIVDDNHTPVARGEQGGIRYRSPGISPGYVVAPPGDESFHLGWFYPGDYGHLTKEGSVVLSGRADDLLNFGGSKVDSARIEEQACAFPGVMECAAFTMERRPGITEIGLAVVAAADTDLRALDQDLRKALPGRHPTIFGRVDAIPRNRMGKIIRGDLRAEVARKLPKIQEPQ